VSRPPLRDLEHAVNPGGERMSVRVTLLSYLAGVPYSPIPAPGTFIDEGNLGGLGRGFLGAGGHEARLR